MSLPGSQPQRQFKSHHLEKQLARYALAAAATAGVLGTNRIAEAEVVYTPAHQPIAPNTTVKIDLNNDGTADFNIKDTFSTSFFSSFGKIAVLPIGNENAVWGHAVSRRAYASTLFSGAVVGPKNRFLPGAGSMAEVSFLGGIPLGSSSCTAPWANVSHRYLGLKLVVNGEAHFGWARLDVNCAPQRSTISGLLTGYAYETVADRPVIVGRQNGPRLGDDSVENDVPEPAISPAGLGRLAQGATGLSAWRRK